MNKNCLITFLLVMSAYAALAQDLSDDPVWVIRSRTESNIRLVSESQTLLLENVIHTLNDDNPAFETVLKLRDSAMAKFFVFDDKHIMCKEVSYENRIFSSKILNQHFVGLQRAESGKVYLSPMFLYKNKAYYLLGIKNDTSYLMMLFFVPEVPDRHYAIFHDDGSILINKMGLTKSKIAEWSKIITDADSDKFDKLQNSAFTVFRPGKKYYIIINEEN
ncbi:MAG: hypothetical protein IKN25_03035 [Spirochaetales bacterium]|nr:hypothetical protein [Spirochaetales bacterium]